MHLHLTGREARGRCVRGSVWRGLLGSGAEGFDKCESERREGIVTL